MSLCSRQRRSDHRTTLEGVGKNNIGETLVEGRLGRRCQCEYPLLLWYPSSD